MGTPQHARTAGEAATARGWTPSRGVRTTVVARDGTALTVLRAITYVLVSLTCLALLAGAVYGWLLLHQLPSPLGGFPRTP